MSYVLHDGVNYFKAPPLLAPTGATGGIEVPVPSAIGLGLNPLSARGASGYYAYLDQIYGVCVSGGATNGAMVFQYCSPSASATMCQVFYRQVFPITPTVGDKFYVEFKHPMRSTLPGQTLGSAFEVTLEEGRNAGTWFLTINGFQSKT